MTNNGYKNVDLVSKVFFIVALLLVSLYYLKSILSPLFFSVIMVLVLLPLCQKLEAKGVHRILAILLILLMVTAVTVGIGLLLSVQLNNFLSDLPELKEKFSGMVDGIIDKIESLLRISEQEQRSLIRKNSSELLKTGGKYFTTVMGATTSFISFISLVPVYCFLLLYYRDRFKKAFLQLVPERNRENALDIFGNIKVTLQQYVLGLLMIVGIIGILNITGLFLLGIKYAFFLGLLSALLTVVPYVGVFVGGLIPFLVALITKDSAWYAVGVVGMYWVVQILEGNLITPRIMGSQVNLNALAIIFGLIAGGRLWGLMGLILAVPVIAMLKVIFSHIKDLQPFSTLLGNND